MQCEGICGWEPPSNHALAIPRTISEDVRKVCLVAGTVAGENILEAFLAVRMVVGGNISQVSLAIRMVVGKNMSEVPNTTKYARNVKSLDRPGKIDGAPL